MLRVCMAQDAEVDTFHGEALGFQCLLAGVGCEPQAVQMGDGALPFGEGGGPVKAVGNVCVSHMLFPEVNVFARPATARSSSPKAPVVSAAAPAASTADPAFSGIP